MQLIFKERDSHSSFQTVTDTCFHLLRQFRTATDLTPGRFQSQFRVEVPRKLLRTGDRSGCFAQNCVFMDQRHFIHVFRQSAR